MSIEEARRRLSCWAKGPHAPDWDPSDAEALRVLLREQEHASRALEWIEHYVDDEVLLRNAALPNVAINGIALVARALSETTS